jgi:transmembrane sensor
MDSERLARYLAGEASPSERAEVEAWARAEPRQAAELRQLAAAWKASPNQAPADWKVDFAWNRVAGQLDTAVSPPEAIPLFRRTWVRSLAAAAVLLVAAGGLWLATREGPTLFQTAVGEQRQLTLPDGSRVVLAPASRLAIQPGFGGGARALVLDGRAWFEVAHDPARPFRVRARTAVIEALGTEFEIDATASEVTVAVISGSVALQSGAAARVTLGPKDLGKVTSTGEAEVAHEVAVDRIVIWRKGTLAFDNRPVGQVLEELARWHDVVFNAAAELRARTFTGDIPTDRLDDALATIGTAVGLTARRTDRVITLTFKAAP